MRSALLTPRFSQQTAFPNVINRLDLVKLNLDPLKVSGMVSPTQTQRDDVIDLPARTCAPEQPCGWAWLDGAELPDNRRVSRIALEYGQAVADCAKGYELHPETIRFFEKRGLPHPRTLLT